VRATFVQSAMGGRRARAGTKLILCHKRAESDAERLWAVSKVRGHVCGSLGLTGIAVRIKKKG
jgi:hypothetical protein